MFYLLANSFCCPQDVFSFSCPWPPAVVLIRKQQFIEELSFARGSIFLFFYSLPSFYFFLDLSFPLTPSYIYICLPVLLFLLKLLLLSLNTLIKHITYGYGRAGRCSVCIVVEVRTVNSFLYRPKTTICI
jgi:hypothetical protein